MCLKFHTMKIKEQPNWIEYTVKDFVKVADRGNMDFYLGKIYGHQMIVTIITIRGIKVIWHLLDHLQILGQI